VKRLGLALLLALAARPALAREFRVGYINIDRVIERYEGAVEARRLLNEAKTGFEVTAETLRTEHERIKAEYESQQLTLSEEGKRAKAAEVDAAKRRYDNFITEVYSQNGRIDQKNRELIAPIVERIDSVVTRLALQDGYGLVLDAAKSGIVYSEPGLDLTQLVTDELNREYEPVAPTTPTKLVYAVMPVFNADNQATQDRIGASVRQFAYGLIAAEQNTDMAPSARADQELTSRGFISGEVTMQQALDVARALNADYAVYGRCNKQDRRVTFELSLANVRLSTLVKTQAGESARGDDLQQQVGEVIRVLLAAINRP
jgi:outer membrane protein